MKLNIKKQTLWVVMTFIGGIMVAASVLYFLSIWEAGVGRVDGESTGSSRKTGEIVEYGGDTYKLKSELETFLLIGIDKFQDETQTAGGYNNDQQADFLLLLVLDHNNKTYSAIQLNRDTMTNIPALGVRGEDAGYINGQLALSHTYGSGGKDSCNNTKKAVSEFLHDIRVDHYISLNMDAVSIVNDLCGGVELEIKEDFSAIDPTMIKGSVMTLTGSQALTYVRSRSSMQDSTNINRMARQRQYMDALSEKLMASLENSDEFSAELLAKLSDNMVTDCTNDQLSRFIERYSTYEGGEILTPEGTSAKGEKFMEFTADEDALFRLVLSVFYAYSTEASS